MSKDIQCSQSVYLRYAFIGAAQLIDIAVFICAKNISGAVVKGRAVIEGGQKNSDYVIHVRKYRRFILNPHYSETVIGEPPVDSLYRSLQLPSAYASLEGYFFYDCQIYWAKMSAYSSPLIITFGPDTYIEFTVTGKF